MKKILSFALVAVAFALGSCGNKGGGSEAFEIVVDSLTWPWEYPMNVRLDAKAGQKALCYVDYAKDIEKQRNLLETSIDYYLCTITKVGDTLSTVTRHGSDGREYEVLNSLIIPLPEKQTAKAGDIVLGYWQKGHNQIERLMVTDDSDPSSPLCSAFDLGMFNSLDGHVVKDYVLDNKLVRGSFLVLKDGEWTPGMTIIVDANEPGKKSLACIVGVKGDYILATSRRNMRAYKRSECQLLPLKPSIKEGDKVKGLWGYSVTDGFTVKSLKYAGQGFYIVDYNGREGFLDVMQILKD